MPQMAPMPWITLLMITLFMLYMVSSMIYFNMPLSIKKKNYLTPNNFPIKW